MADKCPKCGAAQGRSSHEFQCGTLRDHYGNITFQGMGCMFAQVAQLRAANAKLRATMREFLLAERDATVDGVYTEGPKYTRWTDAHAALESASAKEKT